MPEAEDCTCAKVCVCPKPPPADWRGEDGPWEFSPECPTHMADPEPNPACPVHGGMSNEMFLAERLNMF